MDLVLQTRRRFRQWLAQVTQLGDVELGLSCGPPDWKRSVFIPVKAMVFPVVMYGGEIWTV